MKPASPKVAILGLHLESNAFAPESSKEDFTAQCWEVGPQIDTLARQVSQLPSELAGFYQRMDQIGPWTPAPLIVIAAPPGGPIAARVWGEFLREVEQRLRAAMPVDAVYVANHGASAATNEDDTEGALLTLIRSIVGPEVIVFATHDLHCNVSEQTVNDLDALVSYRTNPHVDQRERAAEAADLLYEALGGTKLVTAYIRLPLTPPSITLLTARGPYADLVKMGTALMQTPQQGPIANVSVSAGFVFSDLPKCGLTITVTARNDLAAARRTALAIARAGWQDRARYVPDMIDVARAVTLAQQAPFPLLFADVADNPGGGGRGNTAWMLEAFDQAGVPGVVLGVFVDSELVSEAQAVGVDGTFDAVFNRVESEYSRRYTARARVVLLTNGEGVGRRGVARDRKFALGATALLELVDSGMQVVVGSLRRQMTDPAMLEMHGIDIAKIQVLLIKSRGHYRAGFDEFFDDARIFDVDSPGLTSPNLSQIAFKRLPRPVWPIDTDAHWTEPDWAATL